MAYKSGGLTEVEAEELCWEIAGVLGGGLINPPAGGFLNKGNVLAFREENSSAEVEGTAFGWRMGAVKTLRPFCQILGRCSNLLLDFNKFGRFSGDEDVEREPPPTGLNWLPLNWGKSLLLLGLMEDMLEDVELCWKVYTVLWFVLLIILWLTYFTKIFKFVYFRLR